MTQDSARLRVVFEHESYLDVWLSVSWLASASVSKLKSAVHALVCSLVEDLESETPQTSYGSSKCTAKDGRKCTEPTSIHDQPLYGSLSQVRAASVADDGDLDDGCHATTPVRFASPLDYGTHTPPAAGNNTTASTSKIISPPAIALGPDSVVQREEPVRTIAQNNDRDKPDTERGLSVNTRRMMASGDDVITAYQAHMRIGSTVLHFRSNGRRPGAFFFLSVTSTNALSGEDFGRKSYHRTEGTPSTRPVNDESGIEDVPGIKAQPHEVPLVDDIAGSRIIGRNRQVNRQAGVESVSGSSDAESRTWITDESAPVSSLFCARNWQTLEATSAEREDTTRSRTRNASGSASPGELDRGVDIPTTGSDLPFDENRVMQGDSIDADSAIPRDSLPEPLLHLWMVPTGRAPLPALCCGVCGSSWENDAFGRGFRVFHIAVANNASLVWHLRKRFSEFLALHRALVAGSDVDEGIPAARLPPPPSRTYGLLKAFPERMTKFRRDELDAYLQKVLMIPEAMTNRMLLVFLGLVSTTSNDLASRQSNSTPGVNRDHEKERPCEREAFSGISMYPPRKIMSSLPSEATQRREAFQGGTYMSNDAAASGKRTSECYSEDLSMRSEGHAEHEKGELGDKRRSGRGSASVLKERAVEKVSQLGEAVRAGDIFLFKCRGLLSRLQRWVARSEWDHVGMVVLRHSGSGLELMESAQDGVRCYPLVNRVRAYLNEGFASKVAFRRLEYPHRPEACKRLSAFAAEAEGNSYGLGPFHRRGNRHTAEQPSKSPSRTSGQDDAELRDMDVTRQGASGGGPSARSQKRSYVCSQLIGAALVEMGVVKNEIEGLREWAWVLPGAFGEGGAVEEGLRAEATLGEEVMVDAYEPAVAQAVLFNPS